MSEINPVEFGRVLGHLEALTAKLDAIEARVVWRQDDLERRVEALEQGEARQSIYHKAVDRLMWLGLGAGLLVGYDRIPALLGL